MTVIATLPNRIHGGMAIETDYIISVGLQEKTDDEKVAFESYRCVV